MPSCIAVMLLSYRVSKVMKLRDYFTIQQHLFLPENQE
jgi:hypothetical protein